MVRYPMSEGIDRTFKADIALETRARAWAGLVRSLGSGTGTLRQDAWINPLTGLGGAGDRTVGMQVSDLCLLDAYTLEAMFHGEDLPALIVEALPTDALSAGFSLGSPELDAEAETWRLLDLILDARVWSRLHGGGGLLIGMDPSTGPAHTPLRLAQIGRGALRYLQPVQRPDFHAIETDADPQSPTYGDPIMYQIGNARIHPSRVVMFPGARTSPRVRSANGGFDLSVLQRPYGVLRDTEHTWRSVMAVMSDLSQGVLAIKDLTSMITQGHAHVARDRMDVMHYARGVNRMVLLDADSETFEHKGAANLTGIDPLILRVFTRLAAAAKMPLTRLFGVSPAGMNATGEGEAAQWFKECRGERSVVESRAMYLGAVLARNAGIAPPEAITWPALWELSDTEQAALDNARATAAKTRIEAQISDPEEERRVLAGEPLADVMAEESINLDVPALPEPVEDDADPDVDPLPGEIWVDTEDDHRSQIVRVAGGKVYFVDLDADNPQRQWRWAVASFLTRHRQAVAAPTGPAPAGA